MPDTRETIFQRIPKRATDDVTLAKLRAEAAIEEYTRLIRRDGMLSGTIASSLGPWVWVPENAEEYPKGTVNQ